MYKVALTESYFPAQTDDTVLPTTVGGILRDAALQWPDREALVEAKADGTLGRRWSYAELLAACEKLAKALLSRFKPKDRVVVWAPNIPEWVIMEYACGLAGITLVTANPAFQPRELEYVLTQSGAVGLFYVETHRGNPMGDIARAVAVNVPGLREMTDIEDEAAMHAGHDSACELPDVKPEDPAQIQYTSGTTGFPKGAILHHLGLTNNARMVSERRQTKPGSTLFNYMPLFHTSGCGIAVLGICQLGCRMVLIKDFDPGVILDLAESEQAATLSGVPTMLLALVNAQRAKPRDLSSVLNSGCGGAMVAPALVRQVKEVFGCEFDSVYGQTECSPVLTQTWLDDTEDDLCNSVGQASPHLDISVRNPNTNTVCALGEVGEICARGYAVMTGYNNNPEATADAIDADGWLHTGDLGTIDARGYVKITGRVKEMIIRGGENMFPAEIENVLLEHEDVLETAVVGVPDEKWGEVIVCFIRPPEWRGVDKTALAAHCRAHLSPQKTPIDWIEVQDWPLTGSGKIRKFELRDQYIAGKWA